ncbi:MAG: hypothetical protein ACK5M7_09860 [Draconibacterium sp.]
MKTAKIKYQELVKDKRFEGKFYLNPNAANSRVVSNTSLELKELSEFGKLFNPSIFKRQYCSKTSTSIEYKQSHDIIKLVNDSNTYLPKKQVEDLNLSVHEGWILITGFGTVVGYAGLVDNNLNGTAFANNVTRLLVEDVKYVGYLTAFLKSKYGRSQINKNASGSAIRYIEAPGIGKTLVPIVNNELFKRINKNIIEVNQLRNTAFESLQKAKEVFTRYLDKIDTYKTIKNIDRVSIGSINNSIQLRLNCNSFVNSTLTHLLF